LKTPCMTFMREDDKTLAGEHIVGSKISWWFRVVLMTLSDAFIENECKRGSGRTSGSRAGHDVLSYR